MSDMPHDLFRRKIACCIWGHAAKVSQRRKILIRQMWLDPVYRNGVRKLGPFLIAQFSKDSNHFVDSQLYTLAKIRREVGDYVRRSNSGIDVELRCVV